jgi:aspartyl-tRNA synthetase
MCVDEVIAWCVRPGLGSPLGDVMHHYRTHACGQLTTADVGDEVRLSGWLHNRRDLGGLLFVDLRDHYGLVQLVVRPGSSVFEQLARTPKETVIRVDGLVRGRRTENINPDLSTGEVEVEIVDFEILGTCADLPFSVFPEEPVSEEFRLAYRFLGLRRQRMHSNVMLRARVVAALRQKTNALGFAEFQTPILTTSSPEGARDFLVLSRLHPGKFFALPQAPQQFKQLLMVSGFDRYFYFQIVPCFRDEDSRVDRSPGEFYQDDFSLGGPIAKFVDEIHDQLLTEAKSEPGGAIFLYAADTVDALNRVMAPARVEIGCQADLFDHRAYRFCWIVDFPMYEQAEDGSIEFSHNPFSISRGCIDALNTMDPLDILAWQYHRPEVMYRAFETAGYSREDVEKNFREMLRALSLGAPPHGGIAPGIDRIVMLLADESNIRETISFPLNQNAQDLMIGAPGTVSDKQLADVHIHVAPPKESKRA